MDLEAQEHGHSSMNIVTIAPYVLPPQFGIAELVASDSARVRVESARRRPSGSAICPVPKGCCLHPLPT
jgi:hypothetical protein